MRFIVRLLFWAFLGVAPLLAHDPGLSTTQVEIRPDTVVVTVGFAPNDLRTLLPAGASSASSSWSPSDFAAARPALLALAPRLLELRTGNGRLPWTETSVALATGNSVLFRLVASRSGATEAIVHSLVLDTGRRLGHRDYVSVTDERGATVVEKLVGANDRPVTFGLPVPEGQAGAEAAPPAEPPPTFWGLRPSSGIAHIWTGYDHLLFLFGLLVVCRSFRSIVAIISCFTVAHSITLALATLNVVTIPSRIIEPMIAASIVFVGIENVLRRGAEPRGRWALTFGFGLIHGFGFASVLRELGVGSHGHSLAMPLFTFNLGVEIGQISIAAVVLPLVWQLRQRPAFLLRGVPVLSSFVAAAGLYWFLQRTIL